MLGPDVKKMMGEVRISPPIGIDSDGDGVPNVFDCEPHNPRKQGIIHDIKARGKEILQARSERAAAGRIRRKKLRAIQFKAREEGEIRFVKEREKLRVERRLKDQRAGGFFGTMLKAKAPPKQIRITRRKKGKKKKGTARYTRSAAAPRTGYVRRLAPRKRTDVTKLPKLRWHQTPIAKKLEKRERLMDFLGGGL